VALLRCDYFSDVLEVGTSMTVVVPQATEEQVGVASPRDIGDRPVLYLLHGLSDDGTAWQRYTGIERYAAAHGLAVVMPGAGRSFYADEPHGGAYWTFLSEELPSVVASFFRVSSRREDTFVAGLSMGGYGALKWALHQPERFAAAASLSGALDVVGLGAEQERATTFQRAFGDRIGPHDDLFALLGDADAGRLPALYLGCGTEDHLLGSTVRFAEAARAAGLDPVVDLRAGAHEWDLWDRVIIDVLAWLPVRREPPRR
jgi:putative tributyrin esterase